MMSDRPQRLVPDAAFQSTQSLEEGIPRLLDLFDRRRVKVTSHMVGAAVDRNPQAERGAESPSHIYALLTLRARVQLCATRRAPGRIPSAGRDDPT